MKINLYCRQNDGRLNALFRWLGPLRHSLFEERRVANPVTYAKNPEVELEIQNFAQGGAKGSVGLLVGPVGIGKTTVLSYFASSVWCEPKLCDPIMHDCSGQSYSQQLGNDFALRDLRERRQIASSAIVGSICSKLSNHYGHYCDANLYELVNFIRKHNRGILRGFPADSRDPLVLTETANKAETFDPIGFWSCVVLFAATNNGFKHVKYIIDNIDDKDAMIVTQFVEEIAHFQRRINEIAATMGLPEFRFTPILACRPTTLHRVGEVIDADPEHIGQGWAGVEYIVMDRPCSISEALRKRYEVDCKADGRGGSSSKETVRIEFDRDYDDRPMYWHVQKERLFPILVSLLDDTEQLTHILALSNYNVAKAMSMVLRVLSNARFVPIKEMAAHAKDVESGDQVQGNELSRGFSFSNHPRDLFPKTTAIRALAYGNQASRIPVYPACDTPVHNLLDMSSDGRVFSLAELHVLIVLLNSGNIEATRSRPRVVASASTIASLLKMHSPEFLREVLDHLFDNMLIAPSENFATPSSISEDSGLVILPRGAFLVRQLEADSVLLECWRDNIDIPESFMWEGRRFTFSSFETYALLLSDRALQVLALIHFIAQKEVDEAKRMSDTAYAQFCSVRGPMIASRALKGFRSSIERHYRRKLNPTEHDELITQVQHLENWLRERESEA